jgi:alkanesulfonate monooxygenase SsuD/methylene tetrahydromethanopterin reductase-like flavin-dependent oxidoreductase (luciferase family)
MKFFFFHLMPYADLDLNYTEKYESAWVTLPNTYYDRKKGSLLYGRYLDELIYADALGFDGVGINEHHQNAYGLMPAPAVIAGALARNVTGKIAVLGRALPLVNNPLVIAEEFAMIDQITEGRLIAGFVRGIGGEYHSWGANPAESHERFLEAHDLIIRAWTEPGPFAFESKHYDFEYVNLWPRTFQEPHPPVWIPSQGSTETIQWAAKLRYTYLQTYSPIASVRRCLEMYKAEAERNGYSAAPDQLGWMAPIYVAETDERAREEARPHIEAFANKFMRKPLEMKLPPGYVSLSSYKMLLKSKSAQTVDRTMEELIDSGTFICGSPATVRELLLTRAEELGHGNQLCLMQFGTLPADLTRKNMELFAGSVMPFLRERIAVSA